MPKQPTMQNAPSAPHPEVGAALSKHHEEFLGFLTKRMGNVDDAKDVLQDFCVKAIAKQDQLSYSPMVGQFLA
ncbi:MAG: hypothetical protein Q9M45_01925 [Robiginitomaculum sp.]|nr:hypothetical protein [Robiginitomaculum sp.]